MVLRFLTALLRMGGKRRREKREKRKRKLAEESFSLQLYF